MLGRHLTSQLTTGDKLGCYEIVALLGTGGMAQVYRARDTRLQRDIALKILSDEDASDSSRISRFNREARILASLNHPNIATTQGLAEFDKVRALVMEMVDGCTLADRIKLGPLSIVECLLIAKQIAEGLEYLHQRGIIHRDLKPTNIKIMRCGQVKLLDFGLAKEVAADPRTDDFTGDLTLSGTATQAGQLLGTPAYMSPEQARGKTVDQRTDIWSFGIVLFEMLTGRRPFDGETTTDVLAEVIKSEPDWLHVPSDTPLGVRELLHRCLRKNSNYRLQAARELRIAIEDYLAVSAS